jgi:hypothetical protein
MPVDAWREPINQVNAFLGLAVALIVFAVALLGIIDTVSGNHRKHPRGRL